MIESIISSYSSEADFCKAMGLSQQFYSQIKKGKRRWPPKTVVVLQRTHGLNPSELRPDVWPPLSTPTQDAA